MTMNSGDFETLADAMLERIARSIESSGAECDCESKGSGVLELEFANGSRIVINRHSAAQEIWIAAKSGGFHFRAVGPEWIDTRDRRELLAVLSELISQQSGGPVALR